MFFKKNNFKKYGSDFRVCALLETIRLRQDVPTYRAFLDIRKAFEVAWADVALLQASTWLVSLMANGLIVDLISDRRQPYELIRNFRTRGLLRMVLVTEQC